MSFEEKKPRTGIRLPYAVHNRAIARFFCARKYLDARLFGIFDYSW